MSNATDYSAESSASDPVSAQSSEIDIPIQPAGVDEALADSAVVMLLTTADGTNVCKTFKHAETGVDVTPYGKACHFSVSSIQPQTIAELAQNLDAYSQRRDVCVIRGVPTAVCNLNYTRRTMAGADATFASKPRSWAMVDYDRGKPSGAPSLVDDPDGAVEAVLAQSPPEMQKASCWYQLGNSAGINPNKYSLHLWFLLDAPVQDSDLRAYFKEHGFDPALANAIQVHYIAKPVFVGMADPVPRRSGIRRGKQERLAAGPIVAAGTLARKIAEIEARQAAQERLRDTMLRALFRSSGDRGTYVKATVADLLDGPFADIVTTEASDGWVHCACPVHASSSNESLHINRETGQWRCHGCDVSGGTAWSLAMFLVSGDRDDAIAALKSAVPRE